MPYNARSARIHFAFQLVREQLGPDDLGELGWLIATAGGRKAPYKVATLERWLNGATDPSLDAIESICRLVSSEVDPTWLAWGLVGPVVAWYTGPKDPELSGTYQENPCMVEVPFPQIRAHIAHTFCDWGIILPFSVLAGRKAGALHHHGWSIQYLFGRDGEEWYLDDYASHHMTNDSHRRVWESGRVEELPASVPGYLVPSDSAEAAQIKRGFFAENQRIAEMLAEKGFGLSIDGLLQAGLIDPDDLVPQTRE